MQSRWNDSEAAQAGQTSLDLRVYSSRLLGSDPSMVLHGGGNTSVKETVANLFGESEDVLCVKGSGWDLAAIETAGFAPVRMSALLKLARMDRLSDSTIVREQRAALLDPSAPDPSIEAILHAIIPHKFVDHTHADAVVAVSNTPDGEKRVREIYGDRVLVVPYVMPGFTLAREIYRLTRDVDWAALEGMILLHHGVFSFADDARQSYERMIALITQAENYLEKHGALNAIAIGEGAEDLPRLAHFRKLVSTQAGQPMIALLDNSPEAVGFSNIKDVGKIASRGPLTPDHVIRTKPAAAILDSQPDQAVSDFARDYTAYYQRHAGPDQVMLDPAPRWGVWPGRGALALGANVKAAHIALDIVRHTMRAIQWAEALGGWRALPEKDIFDMEYWELEQAKLKKGRGKPLFEGKIALVTGAASGIGKACVEEFLRQGAAVAALDVNPRIESLFSPPTAVGIVCDLTSADAIREAVARVVRSFGGLDILISNAGIFPPSRTLEEMDQGLWAQSMAINLHAHENLLHHAIPYLKLGVDPAVVIIGSKNVPAPGPGQSAYSVAKAGLTQLARVAALELGKDGIRVNVVHPNQVFDTGLWTPEVLEARARSYSLSVEQYKTNNVLGVEVASRDVAALACALAGPLFAKTTGAQIPIDGGNDRVI